MCYGIDVIWSGIFSQYFLDLKIRLCSRAFLTVSVVAASYYPRW